MNLDEYKKLIKLKGEFSKEYYNKIYKFFLDSDKVEYFYDDFGSIVLELTYYDEILEALVKEKNKDKTYIYYYSSDCIEDKDIDVFSKWHFSCDEDTLELIKKDAVKIGDIGEFYNKLVNEYSLKIEEDIIVRFNKDDYKIYKLKESN